MSIKKDLISARTRVLFREWLTGYSLREIDQEFAYADLHPNPFFKAPENLFGQRRTLVEDYYSAIDFSSPEEVNKILEVYLSILDNVKGRLPEKAEEFIRALKRDGVNVEDNRMYVTTQQSATSLAALSAKVDIGELRLQIARIEGSIESDPSLAVGSAKEMLETCCKTILDERGVAYGSDIEIPGLIKLVGKELKLMPEHITDAAKGAEIIRRMLSNMAQAPVALAELRNLYGSGHGKSKTHRGILGRHARLAVGCSTTIVTFLVETHLDRERGEKPN